MSTLSQVKNQDRWKPTVKLRLGQERLYQVVSGTDKKQYSIQLPTGYGKSWCACIAYAVLRDKGIVDRLLIVVPTDQQRSQYIDGLREDLDALGIRCSGVERCDNQSSWVIKQSLRNKSEVFIAGVQSIAADPGYYSDLMGKGRWFVVADEFHHYGAENTWGGAIKGLSYDVIMGMSATPLRADKRPTIFGDSEFDVEVSIQDAYTEGAIKRIESRIGDYAISWSSLDSPDPQNCLMSELEKEWGGDISEYELKREVRYYDKYISEIFLQVLSTWSEYESRWPGQNQILVFAMTCRHAEMIAKVINETAFPGFPAPFADWIGVGEGLKGNRSDKENSGILARFQDNKLPCLVQVNKAGEGFNNKRCCIGLFLDLVGDTPMKRQHIGRFMRVNKQAPDQSSVIFISEDSPAKGLLENLEEVFDAAEGKAPQDAAEREKRKVERQLIIPDIHIIDTAFESERVVYPFGSPEAAMNRYIAEAPQKVKDAYAMLTSDQALEVFKAGCEPWLKEQYRKKHPPLTSEQRRKQASDQVARSLGILISGVLRKRYGSSYPKTAKGDLYKLVNSRWKKMFASHSEMTEDDLKQKNEWVKSLAATINKGEIPTWLNL
jgi:superfamily II DNA or RNA helicase